MPVPASMSRSHSIPSISVRVTLASAIESVQHLAHEGVSFVMVGARYDAIVDVRCHKDIVAVLVLPAPHKILVSCLLETLAL